MGGENAALYFCYRRAGVSVARWTCDGAGRHRHHHAGVGASRQRDAGDTPGFPIRISRSGNYKLGGNLVVPGGQNGIVVTNHSVTIDMNGFLMEGGERAKTGIYTRAHNLAVRNGTIISFKGWGIDAGLFATCDSLRIIANLGGGINVGGYGRVTNSTVSSNSGIGVRAGMWSAIQDNLVADNNYGSDAKQIDAVFSHVLGNGIVSHGGLAIRGFYTGAGDNTVLDQFPTGIRFDGVMPMRPNACMTDEACPYEYEGGPMAQQAPPSRSAPAQR